MVSSIPSKLSEHVSAAFSSANLAIVHTQTNDPKFSHHECHKTTAYYRDSSGRARVTIRARLEFSTDDGGIGFNSFLQSGCISPDPIDLTSTESVQNGTTDANVESNESFSEELSTIGVEVGGSTNPHLMDTSFAFECTAVSSLKFDSSSPNSVTKWAVERVSIIRSQIERPSKTHAISLASSILFDVEITVRGNGVTKSGVREVLEEGDLELCAVLKQRNLQRDGDGQFRAQSKRDSDLAVGLMGLELGLGEGPPKTTTRRALDSAWATDSSRETMTISKNAMELYYGNKVIRTTPPIRILVTLIPALKLSVREVCGARAASGSTLVEITVEHSTEWHKENVTITGIAFHPGQSRLWEDESDNVLVHSSADPTEGRSIQGGELSVIDMSRRVRWGFAAGTAPDLPLSLARYEAISTVIQVDAGEDVRSRAFLSPVSVNAMLGSDESIQAGCITDDSKGKTFKEMERIIVSTDVRWTTSRVAVENSDAFKVDMSLRGGLNTLCRVGAPVLVSLRVLNLSMEPRDLMLLMAKDGEGRINALKCERPAESRRVRTSKVGVANGWDGTMLHNRKLFLHTSEEGTLQKEDQLFSTAVVSEVNGYTFGVWGLSGDDDGTTRHHRDHELLAVDAALLLGEVKGQHSIEAELRFVPLREGTLDVPNLKLYDKRGGKWYNCVHTLKIVAAAKV